MAGRGRNAKPADQRRTRHVPQRGEYHASTRVGWQHGPIPEPPDGLMPASLELWQRWMTSWVAAHWSLIDLGGLRQLIRIHDQLERGDYVRATEFRLGMDTFGISPKGQQDRRWLPPKAEDEAPAKTPSGRYAHLKVVGS